MLTRRRLAALAAAGVLAVAAPQAQAASTTCAVNASGGYINCLGKTNPTGELVDANQASGAPYRIQFVRFSDGARWGWWQFNDTLPHVLGLGQPGVITAQIDNLGTGNPSTYYVEMN